MWIMLCRTLHDNITAGMKFVQGEMTLILIIIWKLIKGDSEKSITFIFGGDVTFGGAIRHFVRTGKCTYNESLQKITPYLQTADFVIVNLEMAVKGKEDNTQLYPTDNDHYIADASSIEVLQYAGINAVTLANNHITDLGGRGIQTTKEALDKYHIKYFGLTYGENLNALQKPLILEKDGILVGILGYCKLADCFSAHTKIGAGAAAWNAPKAIREIKGLRKAGCHIVVLFMHWDNSYTAAMSSKYMRDMKRIIKLAPVDLIVGAHPHTVHPHFYSKKTLVVSSVGNLLFPSQYASTSPFSEEDDEESKMKASEEIWYKQSTIIPNPTTIGKLLKIEVTRNGIVRSGTQYLKVQILPTYDEHCLVVDKEENSDWRTVCEENDPECAGTRNCNILECVDIDANPVLS